MIAKIKESNVLKQIDVLERELVDLKRVVIHSLLAKTETEKAKASLFGSVRGGDITDEMIEGSKRDLFRSWEKK